MVPVPGVWMKCSILHWVMHLLEKVVQKKFRNEWMNTVLQHLTFPSLRLWRTYQFSISKVVRWFLTDTFRHHIAAIEKEMEKMRFNKKTNDGNNFERKKRVQIVDAATADAEFNKNCSNKNRKMLHDIVRIVLYWAHFFSSLSSEECVNLYTISTLQSCKTHRIIAFPQLNTNKWIVNRSSMKCCIHARTRNQHSHSNATVVSRANLR